MSEQQKSSPRPWRSLECPLPPALLLSSSSLHHCTPLKAPIMMLSSLWCGPIRACRSHSRAEGQNQLLNCRLCSSRALPGPPADSGHFSSPQQWNIRDVLNEERFQNRSWEHSRDECCLVSCTGFWCVVTQEGRHVEKRLKKKIELAHSHVKWNILEH